GESIAVIVLRHDLALRVDQPDVRVVTGLQRLAADRHRLTGLKLHVVQHGTTLLDETVLIEDGGARPARPDRRSAGYVGNGALVFEVVGAGDLDGGPAGAARIPADVEVLLDAAANVLGYLLTVLPHDDVKDGIKLWLDVQGVDARDHGEIVCDPVVGL